VSILQAVWSALGEDADALALVRDHSADVPLESPLAVGALVHDAIAASSLSAALLVAHRAASAVPVVELDPVRVATAVTSERHFRLDGEPMNAWAELSGFWRTADGWVRTHANYPHHRDRLLAALDLPATTTAEVLASHLAQRAAIDVEEVVTGAGGIAVAVRSESQWREHPQSRAIASDPLIRLERTHDARSVKRATAPLAATTLDAAAAGIRVLDLTRVIAGPVASRTLALWGADVVRVDPPHLHEPVWQYLDTGAGKRSVALGADSAELARLVTAADVVLTGYRPGSLDRFGLSPAALHDRHPGLIVARLSAWGEAGPWRARRGFDSIVQAASGIAWVESPDGDRPGALPAQALDHTAGYLLAAGITTALRRRAGEGGSWLVETALARVAAQLLAEPRGDRMPSPKYTPTTVAFGDLTIAAPAPHYDGGPGHWRAAPAPWGSSSPEWL